MRHFPRTARRRLAAASVAAALAVGTMSVPSALSLPVSAADDLKQKKRKVENQIDHAHEDLDESSASLRKASARLSAARAQLADARSELAIARGKVAVAEERDAQMQAELVAAEEELAQAEADLAAGQQERDTQRKAVAATVADIYMQGDPELLAFSSLLDAQSPEDLLRHEEVRDVVVGRESRAYNELKAAEVLLEVREGQVEDARDAVEVKREAAAEHLALMQELEAEKAAARSSVSALVGERASAQAQARRARAADLAKLRQLERQQSRIEEILRKRALAALRRQNARNARSAGSSDGVLMYPVDGYVTSPFGFRTHPIYRYWGLHDGVDFGGGCGTPLRAATSGRVVASYWSAVYGRRLVIDHGAQAGVGLASIYNHASSYTVGVGAQVDRGQVIGYEGSTGWSTGCHLHFTVMANGRAVDPMNWF